MSRSTTKPGTLSLLALIGWLLPLASQAADLTQPQAEHALLERLAGQWTYERRAPASDNGEAQLLGSGQVNADLIGAFFVVSRWQGDVMGFDFEAVQVLGYDIDQAQYTGSWVDSFMSYRWELGGTFDKDRDELILEASGPSPSGFEGRFRERYRFESADSIRIVGEVERDGEWAGLTNTHLTRRR